MKALALLVLVLLAAAGCGGDDEQTPLIAADKTAVVRGALVPNVHLFGEPVEAQVDVDHLEQPAVARLRVGNHGLRVGRPDAGA